MKTSEAQRRATAKYDAANTRFVGLKLNKGTDADILKALDHAKDHGGMQSFIKDAIRSYIG